MEMRIGRQREVDRKGREREHKQENEKRLKNIQRFFFGFDTWLWGVRSKWRKLGQRRAKRAKESLSPSYGLPCVAQLTSWDYADAARGSVLSTSLWGQTKMGERERLLWCVPQPSSPNSFTTAQIPASSHKPPLCMGVFEIVNPYVLKWTWHKACCWSFITCVCVCACVGFKDIISRHAVLVRLVEM